MLLNTSTGAEISRLPPDFFGIENALKRFGFLGLQKYDNCAEVKGRAEDPSSSFFKELRRSRNSNLDLITFILPFISCLSIELNQQCS